MKWPGRGHFNSIEQVVVLKATAVNSEFAYINDHEAFSANAMSKLINKLPKEIEPKTLLNSLRTSSKTAELWHVKKRRLPL